MLVPTSRVKVGKPRTSRNHATDGGGGMKYGEADHSASPASFRLWRRLQAALLALVLLDQPDVQRLEIVGHGRGVAPGLAGEGLHRLRPGSRGAHLHHGVELRPDRLVAVDRAAVQRTLPASLAAGRPLELELVDVGQ